MNQIEIILRNGKPSTTSLEIARVFGKRHDNVLRAIEKLDLPVKFRHLNFEESSYADTQDKQQPMYYLTRDGFTILAMSFTGKAAMKFKIAYIEAFNRIEESLYNGQHYQQPRLDSTLETDDDDIPIPATLPAASIPDYRKSIMLARNGYRKTEIAQILNRPLTTVRGWFARAYPTEDPLDQIAVIVDWLNNFPDKKRGLSDGVKIQILARYLGVDQIFKRI